MMDLNRYADVFELFLTAMAEGGNATPEYIGEAIKPYCQMMRIAKVKRVFFRPSEGRQGTPTEISAVFYDSGTADELRCIPLVQETNGSIINIKAYIEEGSIDWTTEESNKIRMFLRMLFVFEDRYMNLQMASELVFYDKDTGVGTMRLLFRNASIQIAKNRIGQYAVARINIQHFSIVNTRVGYNMGTEVMRRYAQGLCSLLGADGETVIRLGGDNFMVLFLKEKERQVVEYLTETIIPYGEGPDDTLTLHSQGGIYLCKGNCKTAGELINRATTAFNKGMTEGSLVYCDEIMVREDERAKLLRGQFGGALKQEEIHVFYQPQINLETGEIESAEALCRWYSNGSYIPSVGFIPLLEQDQLVCELDFYMLDHVCRDMEEWRSRGIREITVSVNFSARHFRDPEFVGRVRSIIASHGIPMKRITMEFSGDGNYIRLDEMKKVIEELRDAGIRLAMDGIGAGGRSLLLLRDMPWDVVKLDRVLMTGLVPGSRGYSIVKHVVATMQEMKLPCIGQGVENKADEDLLRDLGCTYAQGFYYDRPMPRDELETKWLKKRS